MRGRTSAGRPPNVLALELYLTIPTPRPIINNSYFELADTLRGTVTSAESHSSRCHCPYQQLIESSAACSERTHYGYFP